MNFMKTYIMVLVLCCLFMFFGGWMLFDFSHRFFIATAACAFIISIILWVIVSQSEKIEHLEARVKALEEAISKCDTK